MSQKGPHHKHKNILKPRIQLDFPVKFPHIIQHFPFMPFITACYSLLLSVYI